MTLKFEGKIDENVSESEVWLILGNKISIHFLFTVLWNINEEEGKFPFHQFIQRSNSWDETDWTKYDSFICHFVLFVLVSQTCE